MFPLQSVAGAPEPLPCMAGAVCPGGSGGSGEGSRACTPPLHPPPAVLPRPGGVRWFHSHLGTHMVLLRFLLPTPKFVYLTAQPAFSAPVPSFSLFCPLCQTSWGSRQAPHPCRNLGSPGPQAPRAESHPDCADPWLKGSGEAAITAHFRPPPSVTPSSAPLPHFWPLLPKGWWPPSASFE